ncbi:hypothetical protein MPC4_70072 [Methylocella tundrae]|uniref:Uncharacterized protein n=1 Tax=Methylocella tundrae TaxID=227605 RepID=A0A8B6MB94_METTU|nr:hypothetical protein [Methylocella tundrae]VTZ27614.1 hypothetical protein MPC1_6010002 [Methylocella tundrae]VTZ52184.1 hypothetical protein MPC4_70072 [Methylocella tundrae]
MTLLNPENLRQPMAGPAPTEQIAVLKELQDRLTRAFEGAWRCDPANEPLGNPRLWRLYKSTLENAPTLHLPVAIQKMKEAIWIFDRYASATPIERMHAHDDGTLEIGRNSEQEKLQRDLGVFDAVRAAQSRAFDVVAFLSSLRGRGIELTLADGSICAPKAAPLTPADVGAIKEHKAAIVDELGRQSAAAAPAIIA